MEVILDLFNSPLFWVVAIAWLCIADSSDRATRANAKTQEQLDRLTARLYGADD